MNLSRRLTGAARGAALPAATALTMLAAMPAAHAQEQRAATLRVLTPRAGEAIGANSFNLDVEFKSLTKSPVTTAELWVDGVRWVRRDLDGARLKSTLSFEVDATTLSAGTHNVLVRVFSADGRSASVTLPVIAGSDDATTERTGVGGPELNFATPGNGKRVSGTVELVLDAQAPAGQSPYVTIYIDKQFKTLKNYPPYSYTWDTTQVSNGYHTVEATGYLETGNGSVTRKLRVYVDNPGGNTERMGDIKDLSEARRKTEGAPVTSAAAVASGRTLTIPTPKAGAVKPAAPAVLPPVGEAKLAAAMAPVADSAAPATLGLTESAAPLTPARAVVAVTADVKVAVPQLALADAHNKGGAAAEQAVVAPLATASAAESAAPTLARPLLAVPKAPATTVAPRSVAAPSAIAAPVRRAALAVPSVGSGAMVPVRAAAVKKAAPVTKAAPRPTFQEFAPAPDVTRGLQVAFDGRRIAFDVQPRVEAGLPIAPFRQIFEHTGGRVTWAAETRTVRAVNADREVIIPVGRTTATVNGENIPMDRAAFLERGRTIVPLSFVGKALDVNVDYDPQTGRLQITSKK